MVRAACGPKFFDPTVPPSRVGKGERLGWSFSVFLLGLCDIVESARVSHAIQAFRRVADSGVEIDIDVKNFTA